MYKSWTFCTCAGNSQARTRTYRPLGSNGCWLLLLGGPKPTPITDTVHLIAFFPPFHC